MDARELYLAVFRESLKVLEPTKVAPEDRLRQASVQARAAIQCLVEAATVPNPPQDPFRRVPVPGPRVRNVAVGEREQNAEA